MRFSLAVLTRLQSRGLRCDELRLQILVLQHCHCADRRDRLGRTQITDRHRREKMERLHLERLRATAAQFDRHSAPSPRLNGHSAPSLGGSGGNSEKWLGPPTHQETFAQLQTQMGAAGHHLLLASVPLLAPVRGLWQGTAMPTFSTQLSRLGHT